MAACRTNGSSNAQPAGAQSVLRHILVRHRFLRSEYSQGTTARMDGRVDSRPNSALQSSLLAEDVCPLVQYCSFLNMGSA